MWCLTNMKFISPIKTNQEFPPINYTHTHYFDHLVMTVRLFVTLTAVLFIYSIDASYL